MIDEKYFRCSMKPIKFMVLVSVFLVAAVMLGGCDASRSDNFFADQDYPERQISEYVTAVTEFSEYDRSVEKIKLTVTNDSDDVLGSGEEFYLQKFEDGKWRSVAVSGQFHAIAFTYDPQQSYTYTADLKDRVKLPLPEGEYRVGFLFDISPEESDYVAYAEFSVK